jgi:hypothetical protein
MKYDVGDWIFMLTCSEVNPKWERIICFHQFASFAACTGHDTVWQHVSYPNRHFTSVAGTCTCTSCIGRCALPVFRKSDRVFLWRSYIFNNRINGDLFL